MICKETTVMISADILAFASRIKIPFKKKLKPERSQGMLAIIRRRIFYLPLGYPKIYRLRYKEI
jgi:hypothetical protein